MLPFKPRFTLSALFVLALLISPYPLCAQATERPIRVAVRIFVVCPRNPWVEHGACQIHREIID